MLKRKARICSSQNIEETRRSRGSFSVLFGFIFLIVGCLLIASGTVSNAHRALVMKSDPQPISYQQLAHDGLGGVAFVSLKNVDFDRASNAGPLQSIQSELSKWSDGATANDPANRMERIGRLNLQMAEPANRVQLAKQIAESCSPVQVYPKNGPLQNTERRVSIVRSKQSVDLASAQIDRYNEIRGYISIDNSDATRRNIEQISDQLNRPDRELFDASAWLGIIKQSQQREPSGTTKYLIAPMDEPPSRMRSFGELAAAGLAIVLGWLLCGSGTASWLMWILSPIPAIVGLVGFPLRRDRGGRITRTIYMMIGMSLLVAGGYEMFVAGRFGFPAGNLLEQSFGFLMLATGIAAISATILHCRVHQSLQDFLPPPPKSPSGPPVRSILRYQSENYQNLDALNSIKVEKAISADTPVQYFDPSFIAATDDACHSVTMDAVDRLASIGFSNPSYIRRNDDYTSSTIAVQFGGQQNILVEISDNGSQPALRFTSILLDGLAIITVSENICPACSLRSGEHGVYQAARAEPIESLLTSHLEQTIRLAEKRGSNLVTFDHQEKLEICLYSRRVFADLQRQFGNSQLTVPPASYERFHFPPQPVQELCATFSID